MPLAGLARFLRRLHGDQRGTISIVAIPTIIFFTMLMGMLINIGRHVDDKVKSQNAADATSYTGGVALARGMNGVAFTNHLLSEVFALTSIMREARDKHVDPLIPPILAAWTKLGPIFQASVYDNNRKFPRLGAAITTKVPLEQTMVTSYSNMMAALSPLILPVLENILAQEMIPQFQRALVQNLPQLVVKVAADSIAQRQDMRSPMNGVLWQTRVAPVGFSAFETDPNKRTLPAVDPSSSGSDYNAISTGAAKYRTDAIKARCELAHGYLNLWNGWSNPRYSWSDQSHDLDDFLTVFDKYGTMSQYGNLWRIFTSRQLEKLLCEYPTTNLPHMIRLTESGLDTDTLRNSGNIAAVNQYLDWNFNFVGVAYRKPMTETSPGMFKNRLVTGAPASPLPLAYAQVSVFVPVPRYKCCPWSEIVGFDQQGTPIWVNHVDDWGNPEWPMRWDLFNQNWTAQLAPATSDSVAAILQSQLTQQSIPNYQPPNLGNVAPQDLRRINTH